MGTGYPLYPYFDQEVVCAETPVAFPPQRQPQHPGLEWPMHPRPIFDNPAYVGSGKLRGRVALITGGDSGIGRAVAVAFAKEGADSVITYLYEDRDAAETVEYIEGLGRRCLPLRGDVRNPAFCQAAVRRAVEVFGGLNVLVNNNAFQFVQPSLLDISDEQLEATFRTNVFSFFYFTKAALPYLKDGDAIINTTSITAYEGEPMLIDYSSSKGAIVSLTRSLSQSLVDHGIRVNAVAPGPVWTPLTVSSWPAQRVAIFGTETPMRRAAQPFELAPTYVYLASDDSRYVTGQVLHVNGGKYRSS